MGKFVEAYERLMKMFSKKPQKMTMQQQIAFQLREGKKPNPIDDIFGKWPGNESDEEFEQMLKDLENEKGKLNEITMNYLIVTNNHEPFYTNWFDVDNHFNKDLGMVVYNLITHKYTTDGKEWYDIKQDHL